jgi:zinc and cadmium transporter
MTEILLAVYCLLIVAASVSGGQLPALIQMTHLRTQILMSFVAGLMLGIAMLHMLPHASHLLGSASVSGAAALAGIIAMFILLRAFHTHAHELDEDTVDGQLRVCGHGAHEHGTEHGGEHHHPAAVPKHLGWLAMLFGLGLHTLMDGVALAASVAAEAHHTPWLGLAGLGTFLAVALHKPLDAFAITSVMNRSGWTPLQQSLVNLAFSLACPVGATLFYLGVTRMATDGMVLGWGLALSAGFFICISLADLLPEVAFHDHDRLKLTTALLLGVGLAVGIENLPGHSHTRHHAQMLDRPISTEHNENVSTACAQLASRML